MNDSDNVQEAIRKTKPVARPPDLMGDDRVLLAWQRSHMANERTFLSWCRTSISLLAFGFVIEKFELFIHHLLRLEGAPPSEPSGEVVFLALFSFALAGTAIILSGVRFMKSRRHIDQGEPTFSIIPDVLVIVSAIVIVTMTLLLTVPRLLEMNVIIV